MAALGSRYELFELIGQGTSGAVHRARDLVLGREIAIKVLSASAGVQADARARAVREAQVAARFRHPIACEVYAIGEVDDRIYIAMELIRGSSLDVAIRDVPVPFAAVARIGGALAEMLTSAHAVGLVHRDLKPANVLVSGPLAHLEFVRVVDFGLAFLVEAPLASLGRLTQASAIVGTPAYMAPEQIEHAVITPAADIYALGCVLYELATRRTPFLGALNQMLAAHLYLPPIPPSEVNEALPAALDELLLGMLAKRAVDRPTAADVHHALAALARGDQRTRSSSGQTRADRAVTGGEPTPGPAPSRAAIGLLVPDPGLAAALTAAGVPIHVTGATVLLVALGPGGEGPAHTPLPRDVPVVGLMPTPTPLVLAAAIRAGFAAVLRWPASPPELVARLEAVVVGFRITCGYP